MSTTQIQPPVVVITDLPLGQPSRRTRFSLTGLLRTMIGTLVPLLLLALAAVTAVVLAPFLAVVLLTTTASRRRGGAPRTPRAHEEGPVAAVATPRS